MGSASSALNRPISHRNSDWGGRKQSSLPVENKITTKKHEREKYELIQFHHYKPSVILKSDWGGKSDHHYLLVSFVVTHIISRSTKQKKRKWRCLTLPAWRPATRIRTVPGVIDGLNECLCWLNVLAFVRNLRALSSVGYDLGYTQQKATHDMTYDVAKIDESRWIL